MPKYLVQASYTGEGLTGLQKDKATGRKDAVTKAVEGLGGKLECIYLPLARITWWCSSNCPTTSLPRALRSRWAPRALFGRGPHRYYRSKKRTRLLEHLTSASARLGDRARDRREEISGWSYEKGAPLMAGTAVRGVEPDRLCPACVFYSSITTSLVLGVAGVTMETARGDAVPRGDTGGDKR